MAIDWVTVLAQLANFLLLVWLLRRFLYRPILAGIDAREAEIARRMTSADTAREEARAAEEHYRRLLEQTLAERDVAVAEALQATEDEREQLLSQARTQREQERREWQQHLERERREFQQRVEQDGAATVLELLRKALHELADEPLEAAIARRASTHLAPLADELAAAVGAQREATVTTQAGLPADVQESLRAELAHVLPGCELRFAVDPDQPAGIAIAAGGARAAWTIDSYVDELEDALARAYAGTRTRPVEAGGDAG